MDTFVPPGWMSRTELVNRAGELLFSDGWLGALPTPLEILEREERRPLDLTPAERALAGRHADGLLKALRAKEPERAKMHDRAVDEIRQALWTGEIPSGLKDGLGEIFQLPPQAWGGEDFAFDAFAAGEANYRQPVKYPYHPRPLFRDVASGMVLFDRDAAEAWRAHRKSRLAHREALVAVAEAPADPDGPAPGARGKGTEKEAPIPATPIRPPRRRGPKPTYDWDAFDREIVRIANTPDGLPEYQCELEEIMTKWCEARWGKAPVQSMIRAHVSRLYEGRK